MTVLLIDKQQTNSWMKLQTIPPGLAGKIVKYLPLAEPIRLQDLEDSVRSQAWKKLIPLIGRVFGPYCKLRIEFFSIDLWPASRIRNLQWFTVRNEKPRLIRCLLYGFFQFGGPETSAGRAIWQSFDRRQERKFLLAHENNSTQQRVSEKVKTNSPCWKSLFGQN